MKSNIQHPGQLQIDKLPKWASSYIDNLRRENEYVYKRIEDLEKERETEYNIDSKKLVTWETNLDGEHKIPSGARIKFYTTGGEYRWIDARLNKEDGTMEVMGSMAFTIAPRSANHVWFKLVD